MVNYMVYPYLELEVSHFACGGSSVRRSSVDKSVITQVEEVSEEEEPKKRM